MTNSSYSPSGTLLRATVPTGSATQKLKRVIRKIGFENIVAFGGSLYAMRSTGTEHSHARAVELVKAAKLPAACTIWLTPITEAQRMSAAVVIGPNYAEAAANG